MAVMFILAAAIAAVYAQNPPLINPTPIHGLAALVCAANGRAVIADAQSLCVFYACTASANGEYRLTPKRCALGSFIRSNFVIGFANPCTLRFPFSGIYSCGRDPPLSDCATKIKCPKGATTVQEGDLCMCDCSRLDLDTYPEECGCGWKRRTAPPTLTPICPDGLPLQNWCAQALPNGANPCQNGGICVNQCTNYICNCTVPNVRDRLCNVAPWK